MFLLSVATSVIEKPSELVLASMALLSLVGRVLFVSFFVLSAVKEFNEFGVDGGSAAKALRPKFNMFSKHFTTFTGFELPIFEIKFLVVGAISLKALGSFLFIFDSTIGATLLILHQLIATPILYDFYNYGIEKKKFLLLLIKFTQNLSLLGGLLFFIGMKNSVPKRSSMLNHEVKTTQSEENVNLRDVYIEHLKDELKQARVESEILFERLNHTQARLNDTQEELAQSYQEIKRLKRELSRYPHAEGSRWTGRWFNY
ncbi:hypothetical protein L2E82_15107 [Cichorium intybus]|uniref:Uncharacterized protein n=1 Tax=Cichorium intybus TaxID=13427 RepID=A0ACB9F179_CICIN|nr:hypothetical protein L2E82_15107 [Cichorium intybus]